MESLDGWMESIDGWVDGINGCMDELMGGWNQWVYEWVDGWMESLDGWINGWVLTLGGYWPMLITAKTLFYQEGNI